MANKLATIVEWHRQRAAQDPTPNAEVFAAALDSPEPRGFARQLRTTSGVALIAEYKRKSPSHGVLTTESLDNVVAEYAKAGVAALSVLTDAPHFGGSLDDIRTLRTGGCTLPILRKDFVVDVRDVYKARVAGADAVLLIANVLNDRELETFQEAALAVGLDVLIETHDSPEIARVSALNPVMIGVNQRNLQTLEVDRYTAERLAEQLPPSAVKVAESGVEDVEALQRLARVGYDAALVGASLLRAENRLAFAQSLVGATRCS